MQLPFTREQFLEVFVRYNQAILPLQLIAYAAGILCLFFVLRRYVSAGRFVFLFLGIAWIWMGAVYHIGFFSRINPGALLFGGLFILQGFLFGGYAFIGETPVFRFSRFWGKYLGGAFIFYALVVYPIIGVWADHGYPAAPLFGVAPCPTTIFTFGILLWSEKRIPFYLLIVPLLWSLVGGSAALLLGIPEDVGLPVSGIAGGAAIVLGHRRLRKPPYAQLPRGVRDPEQ